MKAVHFAICAALLLAAAMNASGSTAPRKLQAFTVTANLDPLDTFDAFKDENGRTFVRTVDSPVLGGDGDGGSTVFGDIFTAVTTALKGGVVGGGEILEVAVTLDDDTT
eukprot:evm.model.scf_1570.3 EVM.evm.TU.scf_1570.3   scf_1570:27706-30334(+)